MKDNIKLLSTGFLQVMFVCMNTVFISKSLIIPMAFSGFMISFIWTLNVKKVAFGNMKDRVIYSSGATLGGITGFYFAQFINSLL
jgi:hypothetical protein